MSLTNEHGAQKNLYDRVSYLLESYEWSDCSFSVSGRLFKAHKLLLGISSPVFKAMFYGPLSTDDNVVVCDIEPNVFQLLLNYVYTDKINISSVDQAFGLLYAAKKYMLEYLADKCKEYIEYNISVDNVLYILNYSDYIQEKQLFNQALELFCTHSDYLFEIGIGNISISCVKALLECDKINTTEKSLIQAVFEWTNHICVYEDVTAINENRRKILIDNGLLQLLRFLVLSYEEFENLLKEDNLLLPEQVQFIRKIHQSSLESTPDITDYQNLHLSDTRISREALKFSWNFCHRSSLRSAAPLQIGDNYCLKVHIRIKASKTVFVKSLGVRTRMAPCLNFRSVDGGCKYYEMFSIFITQEIDNNIVKRTNFTNTVEHDSSIFVDFAEPCIINKDNWYKISFIWPHDKYHIHHYVLCHRDRICDDKVKFEFDDMIEDSELSGSFLEGLKYSL